jgi:diaminohydroxyphosphoribosylaminopyrimidine deaminase/5-amino-6-(5-phosphoribosylamino)uracil reductase
VLSDDPLLTARGVENPRRLIRVVLSNSLKLPMDRRLVRTAKDSPVVVYTSVKSIGEKRDVVDELKTAGVEVVGLENRGEGRFSFADALTDLAERGVMHLLVEPGPTLARYMLDRGQADRVWVFRSKKVVGQIKAPTAPQVDYPPAGTHELDGDELTEYLNPGSAVFFANVPSADLVLARGG